MNTMKSSPANGPGTPREDGGNMGEFNMGGYGNNGENVRIYTFQYHSLYLKCIFLYFE
jgi:hypothetical protein